MQQMREMKVVTPPLWADRVMKVLLAHPDWLYYMALANHNMCKNLPRMAVLHHKNGNSYQRNLLMLSPNHKYTPHGLVRVYNNTC
jgi:hypothetical protein